MPFKKGTSGNPIGRPKGSVSTTTKLIREHISQAIDGNMIMEMLDKIDSLVLLSFYAFCTFFISKAENAEHDINISEIKRHYGKLEADE